MRTRSRPAVSGTLGTVSSTHWLASASGMSVLERGGNAFDAAVAAGLVLQVVQPHLNGPGGEVVMIYRESTNDDVSVTCGQGPAPAAATIERFREYDLQQIPGNGLLSACVPGAFDAWMVLLLERGTLRLSEALEFAIGYAEHGYPFPRSAAKAVSDVQGLFEAAWPTSAAQYLNCGPAPPGSRFRNQALARTLRRIVHDAQSRSASRDGQIQAARDVFYRGWVAELMVEFACQTYALDTSGMAHRGLLSGDDLSSFSASNEPPVALEYESNQVFKPGPWTQGPVLLQQLALLKKFDLPDVDTDEFIHIVAECAKLAFADREAWYGDPAFVNVPLKELVDEPYVSERSGLVADTAATEFRPGSPGGREVRLPPLEQTGVNGPGTGEPTFGDSYADSALREPVHGDTCHLDVVDRWGNCIAATPSGGWLQSSPVIPGLGFSLGTRAQMFWLAEGLPNSLAPGKRPRTTLTPSLTLASDGSCLAFGTPGGDQQDQWSLGFLLRYVHAQTDLQATTEGPNFHIAHFPSSFWPRSMALNQLHVEEPVGEVTITRLRDRGHDVTVEPAFSLGQMNAARWDHQFVTSAADPRGEECYAAGR